MSQPHLVERRAKHFHQIGSPLSTPTVKFMETSPGDSPFHERVLYPLSRSSKVQLLMPTSKQQETYYTSLDGFQNF